MAFRKAVKEQAKLRLALAALAGHGKTYSSLAIACELAKLIRSFGGPGRVAAIDSERGSASKYAHKFDFDVAELEDTFSPLAYVEKLREAAREGYDIVIVDSLSHAWAGKGGALEQKDSAAARGGNSWTAWRDVTPKHNALVDALLNYPGHVIATMRQKMEHVQEQENGKTVIRKVGLAAIQREGMEYEFDLVGDIDQTHTLRISKTRLDTINLGEQIEKPGADFARRLFNWLMDGAKPQPKPAANDSSPIVSIEPEAAPALLEAAMDKAFEMYLMGIKSAPDMRTLDDAVNKAAGRPAKGTANFERAIEAAKARKQELLAKGAAA